MKNETLRDIKKLKNLRRLDLVGTAVSGEGYAELECLEDLHVLSIWLNSITDSRLKALGRLKSLRVLEFDFENNKMGEGLSVVKDLPHLHTIRCRYGLTASGLRVLHQLGKLHTYFRAEGPNGRRPASEAEIVSWSFYDRPSPGGQDSNFEANDEWLGHIAHLNLTAIDLAGTAVTDAGLDHVKGFRRLTELSLSRTRTTDEGLKKLAGLSELTSLELGDCGVTDAGLETLAGLTKLTDLDVSGTGLTDKGLETLARFTNLARLRRYFTNTTPEGRAAFQRAKPMCLLE